MFVISGVPSNRGVCDIPVLILGPLVEQGLMTAPSVQFRRTPLLAPLPCSRVRSCGAGPVPLLLVSWVGIDVTVLPSAHTEYSLAHV